MAGRERNRREAPSESILLQQPDLGGGQAGELPLPAEVVRGALYSGPERRRDQQDWARWQQDDRRTRPHLYPSDALV